MTNAPDRVTGTLSIVTGIASAGLLALHPGGGAHDFLGVLKDEAAHRAANALVHGGFVAVLALQAVCYAALTMRLARLSAVAGLVFFAFGAALLAASMVLDGLAIPALAAKYLAAPNKIEFAKSLFALVGTLIGIVMPMGLAFQSAAMAAWGWALIASGTSRAAGVLGIALGGAVFIALALTAGATNPFVLIGGIAALAVWAIVAGVVLLRFTFA
jgi:hypothetical protein